LKDPESTIAHICRLRWQNVLLGTKGFGTLKAIMEILAHCPGSRLTDVASMMQNSLPAARDYLCSLIKTGAVFRKGWEYRLADPVMAAWLRTTSTLNLNQSGKYYDLPADFFESIAPAADVSGEYSIEKPVEKIRYSVHLPDDDFIEFD